ncbi:hypothetical protein AX16_007256 [Volvariella volvacea WC 439]|nr:hypothetical protein AX16_007256 [Volvariella volvacea WC 439]
MRYANPQYTFLFASLDEKEPSTARKVHLRRLYDILHLSVQRNDHLRAYRAWCILARCKEFQLKTMWTTALYILTRNEFANGNNQKRIDFLRTIMLRYPDEREAILQELIITLIMAEQYREALDELELYLPSFPYQDNPTFHIYAGLLALYLAQTPDIDNNNSATFDPRHLQDARGYFEQATNIDPSNTIANLFLQRISSIEGPQTQQDEFGSDDDFSIDEEGVRPKKKRIKS